ncbi:metal-dependent hydrolase [Acinetobacter rudis]|uniref:Metal-dependent hydrolase n=1 Tax=Acinetobacter rudis TaxID=632955 RepID=A0AAW8J555_9GAMM|nr:metal-dependent hydrolase [Acinetobacter rudis]MDQ8934850.1 metal-dependent hydrolase [Acinetobacter rudis]MDQ8953129.1 metal-dependent hydrolase [Acinetobacter rudis]MDQ9017251.1 metal-dependent hydrolase [Acinetobacter rudis]
MKRILRKNSYTDWPLIARKVTFDWHNVPLRWIPNNPLASHGVNHFSFTLVRGEYFFCRMLNKALPLIDDKKLKEDAQIFIRQEAMHSQAHKHSIDEYLKHYGVDIESQYKRASYIFDQLLLDQPLGIQLPAIFQRSWLNARVALVAAAEHFTSAIGQYVLTRSYWQERGCDPTVSDLFTWHCAEEVEHRAVAYDVYQYISGNYLLRAAVMAITAPMFTYLMAAGTVHLAESDDEVPSSQKSLLSWDFWKAWHLADKNGYLPGPVWYLKTSLSFFKPNYHPLTEASTELALKYLDRSAAVNRAAREINAVEGAYV